MSGSILLVLLLIVVLAVLVWQRKPDPRYQFLIQQETNQSLTGNEAINFEALMKHGLYTRIKQTYQITMEQIGSKAPLKILAFVVIVAFATHYVNSRWFKFDTLVAIGLALFVSGFFVVRRLLAKRREVFDVTFPDALNIMMSAVTAGETINHAFAYVGRTVNNDVGREFKDIAERMKLGESAEQIFERSSKRFPYPPFLFFVITIRANMSRGGQLKAVMGRLIRVLVESRNLEKKKMAMTSEARISAKIVGAIPFIFLIVMNYISPDNLDFVLFNPDGKWILYYVVGSEGLGLLIIWLLVKGIR